MRRTWHKEVDDVFITINYILEADVRSLKHLWFTIAMVSKHATLKILIIYTWNKIRIHIACRWILLSQNPPTREPENSANFFASISNYLWGWGETDEKRRLCLGIDAVLQETWCVVLNGGRSANRPATVKSHTFPRSRCLTHPHHFIRSKEVGPHECRLGARLHKNRTCKTRRIYMLSWTIIKFQQSVFV